MQKVVVLFPRKYCYYVQVQLAHDYWRLDSVAATHSPIIFIGTGEHLHDLDRFEPKPFIRKMLGMGDMRDLVEKVQDLKLDQNKNLMKNLEAGMNYKYHDFFCFLPDMSHLKNYNDN